MTNDEKCLKVIERIDAGTSERAACDAVGINRLTFRSAVLRAKVVDQYAQALASLAHAQAEKMEQAIDDMRNGVIDHNMARVEIDARKWFASKFLPKQYGDKPEIIVNNNNTNAAQTIVSLPPDQEASLQTLIQQIREKIRK